MSMFYEKITFEFVVIEIINVSWFSYMYMLKLKPFFFLKPKYKPIQ
jgi:hypothetical protein